MAGATARERSSEGSPRLTFFAVFTLETREHLAHTIVEHVYERGSVSTAMRSASPWNFSTTANRSFCSITRSASITS